MCVHKSGPPDPKLDHLTSQICCLTVDGRQPRASRKPRSGSMEDHRLHARNFQNADAKNRVEPQASFQKEPRELLVPFLPPRGEARTGTCSVDGKG